MATLVAFAITYPLYSRADDGRLMPLLVAVVVSAAYGGRRAGILSTFLAAGLSTFFLFEPRNSLALEFPESVIPWMILVLAALIVGSLSGRLRETRYYAEQAQASAQEAEFRISNTLERLTDGFITLDSTHRITYANRWAESLLGREQSQLRGRKLDELFPEIAGTAWISDMLHAIGANETTNFETYVAPLEKWFDTYVYPSDEGVSIYFRDITKRRQAEVALQTSRNRAQRLIDSNLIGIMETDDTDILEANDAFLNTIGYSRDDLVNGRLSWRELTPPEYRQQDDELIQSLRSTGESMTIEKEYYRKDGSRVPVLVGVTPSDLDRRTWLCFILDLSANKNAQQALARSEERFRIAQELSLDGFMILRSVRDETNEIVDFVWEYLNPAARAILSPDGKDLVGCRLLEVQPGHSQNGLFQRYKAVVETGIPWDDEFYYEGDEITGWYRIMAVTLGDGLALFFRDITQRKKQEEQARFLANISEILSSSLDYEETVSRITELIVPDLADWCSVNLRTDEDTIQRVAFAHCNPDKRPIMEELRNFYVPNMDSDHPLALAFRSGEAAVYSRVTPDLETGMSRDSRHHSLTRLLGTTSTMLVPFYARGRVAGVITFGMSESERNFTEDDLGFGREFGRRVGLAMENAWLYRDAQFAVQMRQEFLSIASHELKTPLTTTKGYAQLLIRHIRAANPDPERSSRLARQLLEQIERFEDLVVDLLDVSLMQQGRVELDLKVVDLVDLSQQVLDGFQLTSEASERHRITFDAPEQLNVVCDPNRIEQVLTNLISNALKYSPGGGEVRLQLRRRDGSVEIAVSDQGIGISPEEQANLFQPFNRGTLAQESASGTGLGLYITSRIVKLHGGTIVVDSTPGVGSTFTVAIPLREDHQPSLSSLEELQGTSARP